MDDVFSCHNTTIFVSEIYRKEGGRMKLSISNLTKVYGNQTVLEDISLDISNYSSIGIIGESGCGKSTLLRQLAGIEQPTSGEIEINGISPINDNIKFKDKISVVFQKHNLFPHLSIKDNITLILHKIKKQDKAISEQTAMNLLKRLSIDKEADKKPHEVSGGQAQRASIARALSTDPQLMFLDEPTAALDPILTQEVLKAVVSLKNDGRDFIFVTHEIAFLKEFADYVIFLKDGKIFEHGDRECLTSPKTKELANFLRIY